MKLFEFSGSETDWVAADTESEARDALIRHYGISADDVASSYESISPVDPATIEFYSDAVDAETEESISTTAADMMTGKTHPFVVGSTYQ